MSIYRTIDSLGRYLLHSPVAGQPLRICLTITDKCNLRCKSCSIWKRKNEEIKELSLEEMLSVVNQSINMGVKIFYVFGGEPLIRREFFEIVKYISCDKGLFSETVTNGTLITKEVAERLIEIKLDKMWISLDGPPKIHDELRGVAGTFDRVIKGIQNLDEAKKRHNSNILIDLAVTVSSLNYKYLLETIDYVKNFSLYEINVRHMGVFFEEDIENLNKTIGNKLGVRLEAGSICFSVGDPIVLNIQQAKEFKEILREAHARCKEIGIPLHFEPDLMTTFDWRKGKNIKNCLHLWTQMNINAVGAVIPCIWYDLLEVGNIREKPFKEIWNNQYLQYMRSNLKEITACSKCCYFYLTLPENIKRAFKVANFPFKSLICK